MKLFSHLIHHPSSFSLSVTHYTKIEHTRANFHNTCFPLKPLRFLRDTPNCSPLNSYKCVVPSRFFPVVLCLRLRGTALATSP